MDRKPAISVIIPFYNVGEALFSKCIDSILKQTFRDFELLIIDDGSSDEYRKMLEDTEKLDERIILIHKKNGGVSSARNMGTELACGDFITFVDADDMVLSGFLSEAYSIATNTDADIVYGATRTAEPGKTGIPSSESPTETVTPEYMVYGYRDFKTIIPCLIAPNRLLRYENGSYLSRGPVSRLLKAGIAKTVKFPENVALGEDLIWNQRILKKSSFISITENLWYIYVQNDSSAVHRYRENAIELIRNAGMELLSEIDTKDDGIYRAFCSRILAQTRSIVCQSYLTNRKNKKTFSVKYRTFNRLKKQEPWSLITGRLLKIGSRDEKFYYLLLKSNLYFPLAYIKDRLGR